MQNPTHFPHHGTPPKTASSQNSGHEKNGPFNPVKGEMALWKAVITQALMDAGSESKKPEAQHEKARAIRWLLGYSEDFITVCLNAGLDPDYVYQNAKAAIKRGCAWRMGMEKRLQRAIPSKLDKKQLSPIPMERQVFSIRCHKPPLQYPLPTACLSQQPHYAKAA
ncbi:MAG: hypothetical protein ACPG80_03500 [Rickettsiales bacterium]